MKKLKNTLKKGPVTVVGSDGKSKVTQVINLKAGDRFVTRPDGPIWVAFTDGYHAGLPGINQVMCFKEQEDGEQT